MHEDEQTQSAPPRKRGRPRIYRFDELKPGESFHIEGKRRDDIAPSLYAAQRRTGFRFRAIDTRDGVTVIRPSADPGGWTQSMVAPRKRRVSNRRRPTQ